MYLGGCDTPITLTSHDAGPFSGTFATASGGGEPFAYGMMGASD
jgi:hypothetical protein